MFNSCLRFFVLIFISSLVNEAEGDNSPAYCGIPLKDRRIINGDNAEPFQFPWQVPLFANFLFTNPPDVRFTCSGTIISSRTILTAAHCLPPPAFGDSVFLTVGLPEGSVDYIDGYKVRVAEAIPHPYYNEDDWWSYDLALLLLAEDLIFSSGIQPICLPNPYKSYEGEMATLSGWGVTDDGLPSENLLRLNVTVRSNAECILEAKKYIEEIFGDADCQVCEEWYTNNKLCANATEATGCAGDSGGPLVFLNSDSEPQFYTQIGVVSFGITTCPVGGPMGYAKVQDQLYWIFRQMIGSTLPAPGDRDSRF